MQKQTNKILKNFDIKKLNALERVLRILWIRVSIQNKYLIKAYWKRYFMKFQIGLLIILFISYSLSDIEVKKRVLKNKFRKAKKVN